MISSDYGRRCPNQRRGRPNLVQLMTMKFLLKMSGESRLYGIGFEISTYYSIASFSGTSPATGHSHELEDQLQLVQEENKLLCNQFKDLQDQHQKIQEQNEKI